MPDAWCWPPVRWSGPSTFPDNDRPGVMLASAAATYLGRWGVLPGRRIVLFTTNDDGYAAALLLRAAGASVGIVDARSRRSRRC